MIHDPHTHTHSFFREISSFHLRITRRQKKWRAVFWYGIHNFSSHRDNRLLQWILRRITQFTHGRKTVRDKNENIIGCSL